MSHRSIPCPKCNRIWMWLEHSTPENPVCPDGYGCAAKAEPTIRELFDELIRRLDNIEMKINRAQQIVPVVPSTPVTPSISPTICAKCGMKWEGVMGYVCPNSHCPVQVKVSS